MQKKLFSTLCLILLLSSCGSTHVSRPTVPEYAPKGYKPTGIIKYLANGADFVINRRRENAFKSMHDQCKGNYKILTEGSKSEGGVITATSANTLLVMNSNYWYIKYECIE